MTDEFKDKEFLAKCNLLGDEYIYEVDGVRGFYNNAQPTQGKGETLILMKELLERDEWVSQKCPTGLPSQMPGTYRFIVGRECFDADGDIRAVTHDWLWQKCEVKHGISSSYVRKEEDDGNILVYIHTNSKHFPNVVRRISYVCSPYGALESDVLYQYHVREEHEVMRKQPSNEISSEKKPTTSQRRITDFAMKRPRLEEEDIVVATPRIDRNRQSVQAPENLKDQIVKAKSEVPVKRPRLEEENKVVASPMISRTPQSRPLLQKQMEEMPMVAPMPKPSSQAPKENLNDDMENALGFFNEGRMNLSDFYDDGEKTYCEALKAFLSEDSAQLMRVEVEKLEALRSIYLETKLSFENLMKESRRRKEAALHEMQLRKDAIIRHIQVKMEPIDPDEVEVEPIRIKEEPHW